MMENYNLMWGDFTSNLSMTVKDLRNENDFLDVSIACEDEVIDAHKVILSAASPFFKNILKKNKHAHPFIYLNGVKFKDMKNLIDFMYNGEATVSHEDLDKFMAVANDLKVKGLTRSDFSESSTKYLNPAPTETVTAVDAQNINRKPLANKSKAPEAPKFVTTNTQRYMTTQSPKIITTAQKFVATQAPVMIPQPQVQMQMPTYQLNVLPDNTQQDHFIKREDIPNETSKHVYLAPKSEATEQSVITLEQATSLGQLATVASADPVQADLNEQISSLILKYRKEETNKLVWRCTVCNRESDHLSNMRSHVELHIQVSRACDECGKTFNTKNSLRIHKYRNHSNKDVSSTSSTATATTLTTQHTLTTTQ